jgi:uncharacterized protein YjbJ (UPF0337 family)
MDKLKKEATEQELKGLGQQIKGKVQEGAGKLTGNDDLEAKGDLNQVGGKVREKLGETGRRVANAIDNDKDRDEI